MDRDSSKKWWGNYLPAAAYTIKKYYNQYEWLILFFLFTAVYWVIVRCMIEVWLPTPNLEYYFSAIITYIAAIILPIAVDRILKRLAKRAEKFPAEPIKYKEFFNDLENTKTIRFLTTYYKFLCERDVYLETCKALEISIDEKAFEESYKFTENDKEGYDTFYKKMEDFIQQENNVFHALILDPFSEAAQQRTEELSDNPKTLINTKIMCCLNLLRLRYLSKEIKDNETLLKNFKVRVYDSTPSFNLISKDNAGHVTHYSINKNVSDKNSIRFYYSKDYSQSTKYFEQAYFDLFEQRPPYVINLKDYFYVEIQIHTKEDLPPKNLRAEFLIFPTTPNANNNENQIFSVLIRFGTQEDDNFFKKTFPNEEHDNVRNLNMLRYKNTAERVKKAGYTPDQKHSPEIQKTYKCTRIIDLKLRDYSYTGLEEKIKDFRLKHGFLEVNTEWVAYSEILSTKHKNKQLDNFYLLSAEAEDTDHA